jgi:hypothetical protein
MRNKPNGIGGGKNGQCIKQTNNEQRVNEYETMRVSGGSTIRGRTFPQRKNGRVGMVAVSGNVMVNGMRRRGVGDWRKDASGEIEVVIGAITRPDSKLRMEVNRRRKWCRSWKLTIGVRFTRG